MRYYNDERVHLEIYNILKFDSKYFLVWKLSTEYTKKILTIFMLPQFTNK